MEEATTNVEETVPVQSTEIKWYESVSYEDAKVFIKSNITSAARSFIAIGYYLKLVRDKKMYRDDGHESIWDFAKAEYGISRSTASRYMSMNDRFSKDGNSPVIRDEYKNFGKSQLQEMLSLTDEQAEQVRPTDRVEDIRNIRKPKEIPYVHIPGQFELTDFPGVEPEDVVTAAQAREGIAASQTEKQTYTISAEDLLPEEPDSERKSIAISQQEQAEKTGRCIHRIEFDCTLEEAHKLIPGTGEDCSRACCWECVRHGDCKLECYSSARRPEKDAAEAQEEQQPVEPMREEEQLPDENYNIGELPQASEKYLRQLARVLVEKRGSHMAILDFGEQTAVVSVKNELINLHHLREEFALDAGVTAFPSEDMIEFFRGEESVVEAEFTEVQEPEGPKVKTYDGFILRELIHTEESSLELMGPTWKEKQPHFYTKHRMMLDAYRMLQAAHKEGDVIEQSGD